VREVSSIAAMGMLAAGIPKNFKPQSIRGAVASALVDYGLPMEQILSQGRWADKSMMIKYYYRKIPRKKGKVSSNLQETLRSTG